MTVVNEINMLKNIIDKELEELYFDGISYNEPINKAMKYSLLSGGKRIRPILLLKSSKLLGGDIKEAMPFAIAIEMIHTYSLVHDDLPAMDDDDFRRGKPTNHKVFGEAIAILAGDGLLNSAYELMANHMLKMFTEGKNIDRYLKAFKEISNSAGIKGMVGGQVIDILSDERDINSKKLECMYKYKTASLIAASTVAGGFIAGGTEKEIENLRKYGEAVGLAFQIRDDILDTVKDREVNKCTFLSLYTKEEAEKEVKRLCNIAIQSLNIFKDEDARFLKKLVYYLAFRNK